MESYSIKRILVALDTSSHSRAALEAAAILAKLSEAHLQGVFVHDKNWLRMSRLSYLREVSEITGETRPVEERTMEEQLRQMEKRIEQHLKYISGRLNIPHSLRSLKGDIDQKILEEAEEADLITIGRVGQSARRKQLGKTARKIIYESGKPVLLLQKNVSIGTNIMAVYDGSEVSQRGLKLAVTLAEKNKSELIVFALANRPESIEERNREVEQLVQDARIPVKLQLVQQADIWTFTKKINEFQGGLIIIPKHQPLIKNNWLPRMLDMLDSPLLLME